MINFSYGAKAFAEAQVREPQPLYGLRDSRRQTAPWRQQARGRQAKEGKGQEMIRRLLDRLFRCSHRHVTFPLRINRQPAYVVCLDCGKEFQYDWEKMRQLGPRTKPT